MTPSFLVVRLGSLGDLIHTLPAVAAIRRAHPESPIDWVVEAPHRELLDLVPVISNVLLLKGRGAGGWMETIGELRARRYNVAIDFQGLIKSAALARLSGAHEVVGFDRAGLREPAARLFYTRAAPMGEGRHVIDKNLALASAVLETRLSLREPWDDQASVDFPIRRIDSGALEKLRERGVQRFALVNPGAAWPNKRWPAASFGPAAKHLRDAHGLTPVVIWGPGERVLAESVAAASDGAAIVAPETRLPDLVALARAASFMVSGDTGPLHVACAAGTPVVALFGPTDAARNGPWNPKDIVLSRYDRCACHYKRECQQPHSWCLPDISVDDVKAAIDARIGAA